MLLDDEALIRDSVCAVLQSWPGMEVVCQGLRNDQIAEHFGISETTVRHHLTAIFSKVEVSNRFELILSLYRNRFARPPE